ncbi:hypothetical protein JF66_11230 [Cryobacterium sp. MLB-32]|nr:hypothetical protein JF66_11230 [Cryobacterium sp. MLB-32]
MAGVVGALPGSVVPSVAAATDDPSGVDLSVDVLGSTGTPSPRAPAAPHLTPASARGVTQTTAAGSAEATHALGTEATDIAGVFTVSGVTVTPKSDFGPGGGDIVLAFTQRNVTTSPITSSLRFWITNAVGMQVAAVDDVTVADLGPGETRTVAATLHDVGQWTAFTGHVTMTPPAEVRGTALEPVSRNSLIVIPPYFLLIVLASVGALALALRSLPGVRRGRKATGLAGAQS